MQEVIQAGAFVLARQVVAGPMTRAGTARLRARRGRVRGRARRAARVRAADARATESGRAAHRRLLAVVDRPGGRGGRRTPGGDAGVQRPTAAHGPRRASRGGRAGRRQAVRVHRARSR
jgi:hypothetical protein